MNKVSKTVMILYGFGEGYWHGRLLRKALSRAGFTITEDISKAQIVIAHSGGMYELPVEVNDKTILIVGPSCGRADHSWLQTQSRKVWQDFTAAAHQGLLWQWLLKSWWNGWYLLLYALKLPSLWRTHQQHATTLPVIKGAKSVTVITYPDDPWSGYLPTDSHSKYLAYEFISFEGLHDELWVHPERYVALMIDTDKS